MKKLGFGLMRLPLDNPDNETSINLNAVEKLVDKYIAAGFTHFDTAYVYNDKHSEIAFRETVAKRYPRESYTITDKMPMFMIKEEERLEPIFTEQLELCGVNYFDYYWLHSLNMGSYKRSIRANAFDFLKRKKDEGKIKHIGISFHDSAEVLDLILTEHPEIEYVQLQINYIDWEDENIQSRKCYETAVKHGKRVMVMEPLKGGSLADIPEEAEKLMREMHPDMSPASWAIRFAASLDAVDFVLSGMSCDEHLDDNLSYMTDFVPLTDAERVVLAKVTDISKSSIAIPCTACHYCTSGCPQKIAIPEVFAIYNNYKRFPENQETATINYSVTLMKNHGMPSSCIECGQCEEHCPQHLSIIENLKEVAKLIEG